MDQTRSPLARSPASPSRDFCSAAYQINVQQGNYLEEERVDQVEIGMSRSSVEFLLGTPMVNDPFHAGRWDYPYYLKRGRSDDIERGWVVVYFENDQVTRIERDLSFDPAS